MELDAKTRAVLIGEAQRMAGVLPLTMAPPRDVSGSFTMQVNGQWMDMARREITEPTLLQWFGAGTAEQVGPSEYRHTWTPSEAKPVKSWRRVQVEALCKADKASEAVELLLADLEDVRRRLRGDGDTG